MTSEPMEAGTIHLWNRPGIIVVDKPKGPSSHEVAAWVGKMLGCQVGHAGTLDPQVSGVLLVMLGNAVRLAPLLLQHDKEYVCLMRLHKDVERDRILKMAEEFTGRLYQRPPRKSAVKRALRIREIQKLEILDIEGRLVLFRVQCDAGTYIRSLCHHMGLAAGPVPTWWNCAAPVPEHSGKQGCIRFMTCRTLRLPQRPATLPH